MKTFFPGRKWTRARYPWSSIFYSSRTSVGKVCLTSRTGGICLRLAETQTPDPSQMSTSKATSRFSEEEQKPASCGTAAEATVLKAAPCYSSCVRLSSITHIRCLSGTWGGSTSAILQHFKTLLEPCRTKNNFSARSWIFAVDQN